MQLASPASLPFAAAGLQLPILKCANGLPNFRNCNGSGGPTIVSSGAACLLWLVALNLWHLPALCSSAACSSLFAHWSARGPSAGCKRKMDKNCDCHGDTYAQHLCCRQCTDGEAKQQRLNDAGVQQIPAVAVQGNSKRRRLRFQFQNKAAEASLSQKRTRRPAFLHSRARWEMLVREWGKLGSAIRRAAAAVCLAPLAGADEDELDLPYVQLDKVTRAVSREAFGPLYLVT